MKAKLYTNKDGVTKTVKEWAEETGINAIVIATRLKRGHSIDEAISTPVQTKLDSYTDPITGETHSLKEWSEILNIAYTTLCGRISDGWPLEKVFHGEKYKTNKENPQYGNRQYEHKDFTGQVFGRLRVIGRSKEDYEYTTNGVQRHEWKWDCVCSCGSNEVISVIEHNLTNGHTTHCQNCTVSRKNDLSKYPLPDLRLVNQPINAIYFEDN